MTTTPAAATATAAADTADTDSATTAATAPTAPTAADVRRSGVTGAHILLFGGPDGTDPGLVLLVRRRNTGYRDGMLHASVAGHIDGGESVSAAAVREAREELGITIDPADLEFAHLCHSGEDAGASGGRMQVFFACRLWTGRVRNAEPAKHSELSWLPAHRLPDDVVPYCAQAIRHHLDGRPFSVHEWPGEPTAASAPPPPAGVASGDAGVAGSLDVVLAGVATERRAQEALFGVQDLPSGTSAAAEPAVASARRELAIAADNGELTYRHLLAEEAAEVFAATDPAHLRGELVQLAAVAVQWIQALDRASSDTGAAVE